MIEIPVIRPDTQHLDKTFEISPFIFLHDHMPPPSEVRIHIDGQPQYCKNTYIELFEKAGIDWTDKTFITDHYIINDDFDNMVMYNPVFIFRAKEWANANPQQHTTSDCNVTQHFSFMSNNARPHRMLCASVIANYFDLNKISYTYNPISNDQIIVDELLIDTDYKINSNLTLKQNWKSIEKNYVIPYPSGGYKIHNHGNTYTELHDKLFSSATTSIVTEPSFFERGSVLTEKIVYSIYSGHFMIFPGAYKIVEALKRLGFDLFEDIIDHSYQYFDHPGKRVVEAFLRNMDFLKDIERQVALRAQFQDRLDYNFRILQNWQELNKKMHLLNVGKKAVDIERIQHVVAQTRWNLPWQIAP